MLERIIPSQGKERQPTQRLFVEFGPSFKPVPLRGEMKFSQNHTYIGIENDPLNISFLEKRETARNLLGNNKLENAYFVQGDAKHTPLPDRCADEVFLGNIFGDPKIRNPFLFLPEINRIIKPDGMLIIKETLTPYEIDIGDIKGFLDGYHFQIEKEVHLDDPNYDQEMSVYDEQAVDNKQRGFGRKGSYLLFARKSPEKT